LVDKPAAGTLRDMIALFQPAREQDVPCFSSSSLRFGPHLDRVKSTPIGELPGVFAWGRAQTVPHRPDLLGYGIPTVEMLSAVIGTGCESVVRTHTGDTDVITGRWAGGKEATVHGLRNAKGAGWGLQALGTTGMATSPRGQESASELREISKFFRTKVAPVPAAETIEVLAFMEAADETKRRGGPPVPIKEFIARNQPGRGERYARWAECLRPALAS
jgi:predicted dehydrogenase